MAARRFFLAALCARGLAHAATCIDTNPNCEGWAAAGECLANPQYMRSSCALSCDSCDDSVEISADGSVEGSAEGGAVAGIPVSFVHALGDVAELEITWLGDGRGEAESEVPIMTLHQMGERSTVTTFIGHVFAVNEKATGRRISRVRMLPGRDIMTIDAAHAKMHDTNAADVKLCADRYDSCPQRARDGECERGPGWMVMYCPRSCDSCHLRDPQVMPGDANAVHSARHKRERPEGPCIRCSR